MRECDEYILRHTISVGYDHDPNVMTHSFFFIWEISKIDLTMGGPPKGLHQRNHAITCYDRVVQIPVVAETETALAETALRGTA